MWHCVKHVKIILDGHIARRMTDNGLLKLPPDLLTVIPTHKKQNMTLSFFLDVWLLKGQFAESQSLFYYWPVVLFFFSIHEFGMNCTALEILALYLSQIFVQSSSSHPQPVVADGHPSVSLVEPEVSSC